ncbi:MAG: hypothetical protein ACREAA_09830 [Candidatus Polarisedimenticolia bacterium]
MKKAGMAALVTLTLASVALALPDHAEARGETYMSGQVFIQSPVAVFGFSYGNPYVVGHVHHGPVACHGGPLYYYPTHMVYGHYHPGYRYSHYAYPRYYKAHGHGHGYAHRNGHGYKRADYGYHRGNGKHGHHKVRGHGHRHK